jgi:hypothetical protein
MRADILGVERRRRWSLDDNCAGGQRPEIRAPLRSKGATSPREFLLEQRLDEATHPRAQAK